MKRLPYSFRGVVGSNHLLTPSRSGNQGVVVKQPSAFGTRCTFDGFVCNNHVLYILASIMLILHLGSVSPGGTSSRLRAIAKPDIV